MGHRRDFAIGMLLTAAVGAAIRVQERAERHRIAIKRMLGWVTALAGLAIAQPVHALITMTASDGGAPIGVCSGTDGGTGVINKICSNSNFSNINVIAVGIPVVLSPDLFTTTLAVSSGNLTTSDTLTVDVAQTGLHFPGGELTVNLTVVSVAGPVTLTGLGPGGVVLFSKTFTTPGSVISAGIPVGPVSDDGMRFVLAFSGPNQNVNASISVTGLVHSALQDPGSVPGSVIVFPKFINELFNGGTPIVVDGVSVPQTEIEIGAICPPAFVAGGGFCPEHQAIKIRFHWVCPGTEGVRSNICEEEDFEVNITVSGKLAFSANGLPINSNSPPGVPAPPCARGYLIGWVISPANDLPIKFDGLIGNAVIRNGNLVAGPNAGSSNGLSAYSAVTIQADPALANLAAVTTGTNRALVFDGAPGHYTQVTGVQIGDVRFDKTAPGAPLPNVLTRTNFNFLTLDVRSNQPNSPTFINLHFWNESLGSAVGSSNPAFEHLTSTFTEFVCWTQVPLSALGGGNLTQAFQGTRKGLVIAGPANKLADGNAPQDPPGPVTLIGLIETVEGTVANSFLERKYNFNMSHDGIPVPTAFEPLGSVVP